MLEYQATDGKFYYRDGIDVDIIKEAQKVYSSVHLLPGDHVLDLGAHIGAASRMFSRVAAKVIAVEPDPENFEVLDRNIEDHSRIISIKAAVGPDGISLWQHPRGHHAMHRTQQIRGRKRVMVAVVSLTSLLEMFRPTVIKCDIEYGEYELPELHIIPNFVRVLAIELHGVMYWSSQANPKTEAENCKMWELDRSIQRQNFVPVFWKEKKARGETYAICATYQRKLGRTR